ncbi:MAG: major capsid protein, partial [Candidatus Methanomethylicaceae archaeon]
MKRSKFSLSNYKLLSGDMGELIPVGLTEVLPGDTIQQATSALVRCAPLLTPVMHPVHVRIHHWFVPHRLVWDNFENFITGGPDGNDASVPPTVSSGSDGGFAIGSLADYLGVPPQIDDLTVSALPFRGYALIFNEWYRDQDLVAPLPISTADGPDTTTSLDLQKVAWEKDYFTSARPWEQKGPDITIPIGDEAPVVFSGPSRVKVQAEASGTGSGFQDILGTASSGNASVTLARNPSSGSLTSSQLSINAD